MKLTLVKGIVAWSVQMFSPRRADVLPGGRPWREERRAAFEWTKGIATAYGDGGDL
jgi:hypothetical protein